MKIEPGPELAIRPAEVGNGQTVSVDEASGGPDFAAILGHAVDGANRMDKVAHAQADALAKGATDDLHGTMISIKEAEISMKLVGSVRNRLLDAFHELWRISL